MVQFSLSFPPSVTFDESDVSRVASLFARAFKRDNSPLRKIDQVVATQALANAIGYLLKDRIQRGAGKYGWGRSDKAYMKYYYGAGAARGIHKESLMTTVVVIESLYKCLPRLADLGVQIDGHCPADLLGSIASELAVFLEPRWDEDEGHGGILVDGRECDLVLAPRYRHTAWLLRLWMTLPQYHGRVSKTADNLVRKFGSVRWEEEKVATDVAAHSAFSLMEDNNDLCGDVDSDEITRCRRVLEGSIESKYTRDIRGWTTGSIAERGRQAYTLFILAEMTGMYKRTAEPLTQKMQEALHGTMQEPWRSPTGCGVLLEPAGQPSINSSCLAVSAFLRKPSRNAKENAFLSAVMRNLIQSLAEAGPDQLQGIWSWALSYFVKDMADLLPAGNA